MAETIIFIKENSSFTFIIMSINFVISHMLIENIYLKTNKTIMEAKGERIAGDFLHREYWRPLIKHIKGWERRYKKNKLYKWGEKRAKNIGFEGEFAVVKYFILQFAFPGVIFLLGIIMNFPSFKESIRAVILVHIIIESVIWNKKRKFEKSLQKYGYKIYKYLHNQISSGIKVTDAIKDVYEIIEEKKLKKVLLRLSARYELTLDIDTALEEFKTMYGTQEGESFCIAVKQGMLTGDNKDLLARQESIMFKKYFNQIQAETDGMKNRGIIAAIVFTGIIVMMILIPFFYEAANAIEKIFSG